MVRKIRNVLADPLLRGSAFLAVNTAIAAVSGFLFWLVSARAFAPAALGAVNATNGLVTLFSAIAAFGTPEMVIRHYAMSSSQRALVVRALTVVTVATGLIASSWWAVSHSHTPLHDVTTSWTLLPLLVVILMSATMNLVSAATLIAARRPEFLLVETTVGGVVRIALALALRNQGAIGLLVTLVAGQLVGAAASWWLVARSVRPAVGDGVPGGGAELGFALSNWVSNSVSLLPRGLVVSLVAWRAGVEEAAWVAVPMLMLAFLTIVPSATARVLFAEAAADLPALPRLRRKAARTMLLATGVSSLFVVVAAPLMLEVFGGRYADECSTLVRLFALAALCAVPNYLLDVSLNVRGDHRRYMSLSVLGTIGNLFWIALFASHGTTGVGVAWVLGQLCYTAIGVVLFRRSMRLHQPAHAPMTEEALVELNDLR